MNSRFLLSVITLLAAGCLPAMDIAWDFTDAKVWSDKTDPQVQHDFGELGKTTAKGFEFIIDKKYHKIMFNNASGDLTRYPVLEIFHYGDSALFACLAYGEGESGVTVVTLK